VLASIEQDVTEREANGAWRAKGARMVTVSEDAAASGEFVVDGARHANAEALHSAREYFLIVRFGDQVEMVALDGVVDETEAKALLPACERLLHLCK